MTTREEDLAWAAGFFDGEGTTTGVNYRYDKKEKRKGRPPHVWRARARQIQMKVAQVERAPLEKLQATLGGKIYGPYEHSRGTGKPFYQWNMHGAQNSYDALLQMWPHLSVVKRQQAIRAADIFDGETRGDE